MSSPQEQDRARGALYGLAIGDALGMPTQLLSREQIVDRWGPLLAGFEPAPPGHPVAAGMPAGAVTDDTEQAVLLGRLLLSGRVDPRELADRLIAWERDMTARGSLDLLGPSTRRAIDAVLAGTPPEEAGASGDTNGAAMRIAPVGLAVSAFNLTALVDAVQEASLVTHNTSVALAGAAAVAAAVSTGVSGSGGGSAGSGAGRVATAVERAVEAAALGAERGHWVAGADVAARIRWATDLVAGQPPERAAEAIYALVGTSLATQESVPAAFAVLSAVPGDPWRACLLAASLGGDTDTIAAMAGAVAGACHGLSAFPPEAVSVIDGHGLGLRELADSLLAMRA
ncbi:MAG TPA: ADP-ribosylglycohydrolase family protein [Trebonia sp.]